MDDIRIKFSLIGHPKLEKLKRIIGKQAFEHLATLWIRVAQNNPKGNLEGLDDVDIAIYAGWKGDSLKFVTALKDCKFITHNGNGYEIKDWEDHQPFVYYGEERSVIAKENIAKRWNKKGLNTDGIQTVYKTDTPIPSPIPKDSPKKKKIIFSEESDEFKLSKLLLENILLNNPMFKLPDLQKWCIPVDRAIRLDNRTVDGLRKVINWCQADEFWQTNILSTSKLRVQFDQLWGKMIQKPSKKRVVNPNQDPGFAVPNPSF